MKPTKEQIKIVFKKILTYQREQREVNENNVSIKDEIGNEEKLNQKHQFDNEQMLLHFFDKRQEIELKFSQELISTEEDLKIIFKNQVMAIEHSLVVSAFAYEELNNTYRLEAKTLIEEIMLRVGYSNVSEALIIDFLKEIIKEKKIQIEKEAFKRKIIWFKK